MIVYSISTSIIIIITIITSLMRISMIIMISSSRRRPREQTGTTRWAHRVGAGEYDDNEELLWGEYV